MTRSKLDASVEPTEYGTIEASNVGGRCRVEIQGTLSSEICTRRSLIFSEGSGVTLEPDEFHSSHQAIEGRLLVGNRPLTIASGLGAATEIGRTRWRTTSSKRP